jgi:hypothetical protein
MLVDAMMASMLGRLVALSRPWLIGYPQQQRVTRRTASVPHCAGDNRPGARQRSCFTISSLSESGLLPLGRHMFRLSISKRDSGLGLHPGHTQPVEPDWMLDHNGGDHALPWHRCTREDNRLVSARRAGRGHRPWQGPNDLRGLQLPGRQGWWTRRARCGSRGRQDGRVRVRRDDDTRRRTQELQRLSPADDRLIAQEDRPG